MKHTQVLVVLHSAGLVDFQVVHSDGGQNAFLFCRQHAIGNQVSHVAHHMAFIVEENAGVTNPHGVEHGHILFLSKAIVQRLACLLFIGQNLFPGDIKVFLDAYLSIAAVRVFKEFVTDHIPLSNPFKSFSMLLSYHT